jgi:hypothetical protein
MILAVQNLLSMEKGGGKLARLTILWYVGTTILAIIISTILVDLVWRPLMTVADGATLQMTEEEEEDVAERGGMAAHDVIVQVFESFIPNNVASALANDELLAVLVSAIVVGCLIKGPDSSLLRAVREIEKIVMKIITFLIKLAPIGVFFLILSNLFTLNIEDIGQNLGVLVGGSIVNMAIHLFIVLVSSSKHRHHSPIYILTATLAHPLLHIRPRELLHILDQVLALLDHRMGHRLFSRHNARHPLRRSRARHPEHRCQFHHSSGHAREHGRHSYLLPHRRRVPGSDARHAAERRTLRHHRPARHALFHRDDADS